jgi:hypothetical protein
MLLVGTDPPPGECSETVYGISKFALVAQFVDRYPPYRVCSAPAIGCPLIDFIKALRTNVARQNPQKRISKAGSEKVGTSRRYQGKANAPVPLFGIDIERTKLSMARQIRFARR